MMDDLTRSIAELEGMQDIPLPGMEDIVQSSEKISEEVEKEFVYRIVGASGKLRERWRRRKYYQTVSAAKGQATMENDRGYGADRPYRVQRARIIEWEEL